MASMSTVKSLFSLLDLYFTLTQSFIVLEKMFPLTNFIDFITIYVVLSLRM